MSLTADDAPQPIAAGAATASPPGTAREPAAGGVGARLDALGGSWRLWRLIALISVGGFFEIYDLMMTAYVAPALERAHLFRRGAAGVLGQSDQAAFASATFLGLFIGTAAFARLADRFGRRPIFTLALLWYALATLAMSTSSTALELDAWRLAAGVGIGVELVTIDAFIGELAPARLRGRAFAVSQSIQFLAVPAVALASWVLADRAPFGIAGWRWIAGLGAAGAAAVWAIRRGLPESPRWLERQGRSLEAEAILDGLESGAAPRPRTQGLENARRPSRPPEGGRLREAFAPPFRRRTLMLVVFNIAQAIGFYGFGNWAPTLIAAQGQTVIHSLAYGVAIALAWPLSPLACALVADRFERKQLIMIAATVTAGAGIAFSGRSDALGIVALGVLITASNTLLSFAYHAYQAELYPTRIRASAIGFVYAWSRLSTVASSFAIAALLAAFGSAGVFAFIAAAMAVVVATVGLFGPRVLGRPLEAAAH